MASAAAAAAVTAALGAELAYIAPLVDLYAQYSEALYKQRHYARARALATRLLAAVEAAQVLPADSLVLAVALRCVLVTRMLPVEGELEDSFEARRAAWGADPAGTLALSQRCAALLAARAAARTLFMLTPHEGAWSGKVNRAIDIHSLIEESPSSYAAVSSSSAAAASALRGGGGASTHMNAAMM